MANEQQELELRVTLDDEASPQLEALRKALGGLGAGSGGGQMRQVIGGMEEFERALGSLTREALGVGRTSMELAKVFGPVAVGLGTVAYQMQRTQEATKSWGEQMTSTANAARMAGISIGEFRGVVESLRASGVSAEAASAMIVRFTQAYGEIMRVGSARREQLIQMAGPEFAGNMMRAIEHIGQLRTDTEKLNYLRQIGENVYQNELARSGDEMLAAYKRDQLFLIFQTPELVAVRGKMHEYDDLTKDNMKAEAEAMQELNKAQSEYATTKERITEIFKAAIAPYETKLLDEINAIGGKLVANMEEEEKRIRDKGALYNFFYLPGMQQDYDPTKPAVQVPGFPQVGGFGGAEPLSGGVGGTGADKAIDTTKGNTDELARFTDNLKKMLDKFKGGASSTAAVTPFAGGGVVSGPTRALVGEAGPEAIVSQQGTSIVNRPTIMTLGAFGTQAVVPLSSMRSSAIRIPGIRAFAEGGMVVGREIGSPMGETMPEAGRGPVPQAVSNYLQRTQLLKNPLTEIAEEVNAATAKEPSGGSPVTQAGMLPSGVTDFATDTVKTAAAATSGIWHTTVGRAFAGVTGMPREYANQAADIASVIGIRKVPQIAASSLGDRGVRGWNTAQEFKGAHDLATSNTGGDAAAARAVSLNPMQDIGELDRMMGNQMLRIGRSGQMKIVHENAPTGTSVETEGDIFEGAETSRTHMPLFDMSESAPWRHPSAEERRGQQERLRQPRGYEGIDSLGVRG